MKNKIESVTVSYVFEKSIQDLKKFDDGLSFLIEDSCIDISKTSFDSRALCFEITFYFVCDDDLLRVIEKLNKYVDSYN